jgi:alkaline phosphatase D
VKTRDFWWYDLFHRKISRRDALRIAGNASALVALGVLADCAPRRLPRLRENPFDLGIASGDPLPDGVVLWTRLARAVLSDVTDPARPAPVDWEMASDEAFGRIVKRGTALALPALGHAVHAEVNGLEPGREYWYRFRAGGVASPAGRTRTAPAPGAQVDALRFAFVSCQHYEQGYYTAFRHLADENLELVIHLGDYIYESKASDVGVRKHTGGETYSLEDYRARYAQYKSDLDLQAAHAVAPWIVTTDDHEVDNNYAGEHPEDPTGQSREQFLLRRAAAYQAFYEFMPLRRFALPNGPDMRLYRRFDWGALARLYALDTRQYRADQPCGANQAPLCTEAQDASRSMLGSEQEEWLYDGLRSAQTRWNVLANQVFIAQLARETETGRTFSMDKWDGYIAARRRLLDFLHDARPVNPIVLTGDVHSNWVAELKPNFDDPKSPVVATEFVGTSMSSGGDGRDSSPFVQQLLETNPHIRFYNGRRGYVRCTVTPSAWTTDYRVLPYVTRIGAPIETRATFRVQAGRSGVVQG